MAAVAVGRAGVWAARHRRRPPAWPAAVRRLPAVLHVLACLLVAAFCLLAAPSALNAIVVCLLLCRQREIDRVAYVLQDPRPLDAKQFDLLEVRHCPPVPHPRPCGSCALTQEVIPEWPGVCQAPACAAVRLQTCNAQALRQTLEQREAQRAPHSPWDGWHKLVRFSQAAEAVAARAVEAGAASLAALLPAELAAQLPPEVTARGGRAAPRAGAAAGVEEVLAAYPEPAAPATLATSQAGAAARLGRLKARELCAARKRGCI